MDVWVVIAYCIVSIPCIYSIARLYGVKSPYAKSALSTYIFYMLIFLVIGFSRTAVPPEILLSTMLTVFAACVFGHYLKYFTQSRVFDRYLHAFGTFSFAPLAYCILDRFVETGGSTLFRTLFVFLTGNMLGVLFELVEMCHDEKNAAKDQKGLMDTDMDLLFNLIGSAIAGVYACFRLF